ncbi:MAG: type II secretion system F family protein [Phycisphaerae bacterium]|nr:type II secretion system F family protein [Phycisphaerae bacterium]
MQFVYEAMAPDGRTVSDRVDAADQTAAVTTLREKGLLVMRLHEHAAVAASEPRAPALPWPAARLGARDLMLLTRQLKMLLESGAPLVPALEAAQEQTAKPAVRAMLRRLCERVEEGDTLSEALAAEGELFDPVFRSMVAAGEATASLPQVFGRLCDLAQQQMQTRKLVLGALLYPAILCLLLVGVVSILMFFVVPRFKVLFMSLRSPLPPLTQVLFQVSEFVTLHWPYVVGAFVAVVVAAVLGFRLRSTRVWLDEVLLRLPVVGPLAARLIFARVVRIWASMLRCHVPLLEAIRQSRAAITNVAFLRLIAEVEEAVSSGGRMGQALAATQLADPIIVSAIRTGEDNGRLAEATEFVSSWMDEDNSTTVQHVTRLAEPAMLAVMGVVVGCVAMSLFIPLFDLAGAA